jgi:hypothetical protein
MNAGAWRLAPVPPQNASKQREVDLKSGPHRHCHQSYAHGVPAGELEGSGVAPLDVTRVTVRRERSRALRVTWVFSTRGCE